MRYRSSIIEEEAYLALHCTDHCESCPVAQRCYEMDCYYEGEDVIEDTRVEDEEVEDTVCIDWSEEDENW